MTAVLIILVIFGSFVAITAIIFGYLLLSKRMKEGGSLKASEQLNAEETRLIQEIHQGLSRMEERVEALETILLEREESELKKGEGK